jgi:polyvinyl alcohol dehydrogenase (cytochrome)
MMDEAKPTKKTPTGVQMYGPSGAGIWSPPTIDAARGMVYVATGDAYSNPVPETTDAVVAVDMKTGTIVWVKQLLAGDAWTIACLGAKKQETCPDNDGPDHDFGAPAILAKATINGKTRTLLFAPQKSGIVWALDPDKRGAVIWKTAVASDTTSFGGKLVFGGAVDEHAFYA